MDNIITASFRTQIVEGNSKIIYESGTKGLFLLYFKDNDQKIAYIRKVLSDKLFTLISDFGIKNHFLSSNGLLEQKIVALDMLPFFFRVNIFSNLSLAQRFNIPEGIKFKDYLIEAFFNNDENVLVSKDHLINFGWINDDCWEKLSLILRRVADILTSYFKALNISVFSFKLKFGKHYKDDGESFDYYLGDELSLHNFDIRVDTFFTSNLSDQYDYVAKKLEICYTNI